MINEIRFRERYTSEAETIRALIDVGIAVTEAFSKGVEYEKWLDAFQRLDEHRRSLKLEAGETTTSFEVARLKHEFVIRGRTGLSPDDFREVYEEVVGRPSKPDK